MSQFKIIFLKVVNQMIVKYSDILS